MNDWLKEWMNSLTETGCFKREWILYTEILKMGLITSPKGWF